VTTSATLPELKQGIFSDITFSDPTWGLRVSEAPLLSQLYPEYLAVPKFEETPSLSETTECGTFNLDDIALYLHSSGSTGLPKAIPRTHRELVNYIKFREYIQLYWVLASNVNGLFSDDNGLSRKGTTCDNGLYGASCLPRDGGRAANRSPLFSWRLLCTLPSAGRNTLVSSCRAQP
jgi:acyl-CoA synthetase (AMP-forming)/AMP-acid ligase II